MNREQRRKADREDKKLREKMWPGGFVDVSAEIGMALREGDKFTIAGIRRKKDGTLTRRCKPGNETVFTARKPETNQINPAISSLEQWIEDKLR